MILDPATELTYLNALPAQSVAASANSANINLQQFDGTRIAVVVNVGAASAGTNPTFNLYLQHGPNANGVNAVNLTTAQAINQVTNANSLQILTVDPRACNQYLFAIMTIGGTSTPAFPVSVAVIGRKQTN